MLLYLCSNQNINLFDYLDTENQIPMKKLAGAFKLKQFVIHDVKSLSQFSYFLIDLKALKDTETELIEAITAFKAMYNSRVIVLAEGMDNSSSLIHKLIELEVYNIITSSEYGQIKEEMNECMSLIGKNSRNTIWSMTRTMEAFCSESASWWNHEYNFLCKDVKIAVVGAEHKVGTTTTAFHMVKFLVNNGAQASYIEANKNEHLKSIAQYHISKSSEKSDGRAIECCDYIQYQSIKYYFQGIYPEGNNFIVFDFGAMPEVRLQMVKQCEIVVICGGGKPYEIWKVQEVLGQFRDAEVFVVLSHVPEEERGIMSKLFNNTGTIVLFAEYAPVLFDGITNKAIFKELVKNYILNSDGEKNRSGG